VPPYTNRYQVSLFAPINFELLLRYGMAWAGTERVEEVYNKCTSFLGGDTRS
jgi:hypothetical protein